MKVILILFIVAITNVSDGQKKGGKAKGPWYDFWKEPANKTNHILKYFYCRSKNLSESTVVHTSQLVEGFKRLWFVFWLGACPERIKTTTEVPPPRTTQEGWEDTMPWPRGRSRKYPLIVHESERDYVPKTSKPKITQKPVPRCPPQLRRPRLH